MNQQKFRRFGALSVTALLALTVLAACGGESESAQDPATRVPVMSDAAAQATREAPPPGSPTAGGEATAIAASPETGGETPAEGQTAEVVSIDIAFQPAEVTIPANTDVTFSLPNNGAAPHNFSIDALGISVDQAPGTTEEIVINAPAGEYEYYCNVPGHKEAGMVGKLIVTDDAAPAAAAAADEAPAAAEDAASPTPAEGEAAEQPAAAAPAEVVSVDIAFQPTELTIPANTDVTVNLLNQGAASHNFSIDELGISVDQAPGAAESVVINAPAGEYEYYCNVPGHKQAGMVGKLIVTDDAAPAAAGTTAEQEAATPATAPAAATPAAAASTPAAAPVSAATPVTDETSGTAATPAIAASPAAASGDTASAAAEPVEVVSIDIAFEPNAVTIPADTDVTFILPNNGAASHNFSIDELGISVDQAPGAVEEITINAPAGTYEYYCNVPGHKEAGMVGTLTVE